MVWRKPSITSSFIMLLASAGLALASCSDDKKPDLDTDIDSTPDVTDEDVEIEPGDQCEEADECDDRVDCTIDTCEYGWCVNTPDNESCADGLLCNGNEVCHPRDGCGPPGPEDIFRGCDDMDPCTMDICVEPAEPGMSYTCDHPGLDRDGDEHIDDHCEGGDDCDDMDPNVFPDAGEWCFDEKDNDCDDLIDAADTADCTLTYDNCSSPKVLPLNRTVEGFNIGATGDVDSDCDSSSNPDVVFSFTLTEMSDVELSVMGREGWFYVYGDVQTVCGDRTSSLFCDGDSPYRTCLKGLDAGTYYFVVSSWDEQVFDIRVDATPAAGPLEGDDCDSAIDVSAGGTYFGDLYCAGDDVTLGCASWAHNKEMVYTFTTTAAQDVHVRASSPTSSIYGSLVTDCTVPSTYIDCGSDYPFERIYGALPAGTYYLIVESYNPDEFTLDIDFTTPSAPPANNTCSAPTDVSAGGTWSDSLVSATDDGLTSCHSSGYLDAFYTFTTTELQDVLIDASGLSGYTVYWALQTVCGDSSSDVYCERSAGTSHLFRSLAAGTYYIIVQSSYQGDYDLDVTFSAPTTACSGITTISSSTTVTGDTTGRPNDFETTCGGRARGPDLAYLLSLTEESDVVAEVLPPETWDSVLHLREICDDPTSELACDDDSAGSNRARIELFGLAAGDYILVMDGYGSWAYGTYSLQVTITPTATDSADVPDE
jgi:hypothetical protein